MTSSVDTHSVPPFYACYLLRSYATASSSRTYIGSTPDPARRKKQHNGLLSQGAHKTKRGRPWETQMLVYGFPSKISALQFEWAWQKPHLSRHLRSHPALEEGRRSAAGPSSSQQPQHVPLPLFRDTPLNQIAVGEDGCRPLPSSSVQNSLLVARALLRSEPFAGWGLRIVFFEEYLWAAWTRLEERLPELCGTDDALKAGLLCADPKTRLGRPLPPIVASPRPLCDFSGVDGGRTNLLQLADGDRKAAKLDKVIKRKAAGKATSEGRPIGMWPETLPRTLNVRAMGTTWEMLEEAPYPAQSVVRRNVRTRGKAGDEAVDDRRSAVVTNHLSRFHLDDEDAADLSYKRFMAVCSTRGLTPHGVKSGMACDTAASLQVDCSLCRRSISLSNHLSYSTCPTPFSEAAPQPASAMLKVKQSQQSLSLFGFDGTRSLGQRTVPTAARTGCRDVFHLDCLASCFLQQCGQTGSFLLPTHGRCPSCMTTGHSSTSVGDTMTTTWNEVVRCVYRRRDLIDRALKVDEAEKAKAARVAIQKGKKAAEKTAKGAAPKGRKKAVKDKDREGDSDESEHEATRKKDSVRSKIVISNAVSTLGVLEELDALYASQRVSNSAMLAAKRTVPPNWTPQPSRSAPGGRGGAENTADESPIRSKGKQKDAEHRPLTNVSNQQPKRQCQPIAEVIDLT